MGDRTGIEWTDATWNPLRGCSRVSDGCRHCYAETVAHRFGGPGLPYEGLTSLVNGRPAWTGEVRMIPELLDQPLRWKKPRRIFVNSMSDLFHENVPDEFIAQVFGVMAVAHWHTFQVLTKRADRMRDFVRRLPELAKRPDNHLLPGGDGVGPFDNIWLGVSVENQIAADERIPLLLDTPAAVRWISAEPLLGAITLERPEPGDDIACGANTVCRPWLIQCLDWIVAGGESGPHARPTHPEWLRSLRDQCKAAGVPFFFKQWGELAPRGGKLTGGGTDFSEIDPQCVRWPRVIKLGEHGLDTRRCDNCIPGMGEEIFMQMVGKKNAGRLLDGVRHDEYPEPAS